MRVTLLIIFKQCYSLLSSRLTVLLLRVILNKWIAFQACFWISTEVVYLQCCLVVTTWLVPCETAAISVQVLCTPCGHAPVYNVTSFEAKFMLIGCTVLSCNLAPALLADNRRVGTVTEIRASTELTQEKKMIMLFLPRLEQPETIHYPVMSLSLYRWSNLAPTMFSPVNQYVILGQSLYGTSMTTVTMQRRENNSKKLTWLYLTTVSVTVRLWWQSFNIIYNITIISHVI